MDTLRSYCDQIDSLALEVTRDYTSDPNLYRAIFQKFSEQSEVIISSAPKKLRKYLYVYLADLLLDLFSFENFAFQKKLLNHLNLYSTQLSSLSWTLMIRRLTYIER